MSCGAETEANAIFDALLEGEDVTLPDFDMDFEIPPEILANLGITIPRLSNEDLTETTIDGSGTFDILMRGFKTHLRQEYDQNRITGQEYTKAYISVTATAMSQAVQYLLQKDMSYWQAQTAQLGAYTAQAQFETAKMQMVTARFEALNAKAAYALTKLKLATESITYCTGKYQLDYMLPLQKELIQEQLETQRSQTLDTRSDGIPITGSVGKQKELYSQQITSYQRDAEIKAAKLWTDAWITMKTIDEGLDPPDAFVNAKLDQVLEIISTNNGFGSME